MSRVENDFYSKSRLNVKITVVQFLFAEHVFFSLFSFFIIQYVQCFKKKKCLPHSLHDMIIIWIHVLALLFKFKYIFFADRHSQTFLNDKIYLGFCLGFLPPLSLIKNPLWMSFFFSLDDGLNGGTDFQKHKLLLNMMLH